jgi:TolA-binding protein
MNRRQHLSKVHLSALCLAATLAGCASSDTEQVKTQSKIITSCSNSAHMALDAWHLNQVPDAYANRTLLAMQDDIEKAASEIDGLQALDTNGRAQLTRAVTDILNLLSQAQNQIAARNHNTMQTEWELKEATERLSQGFSMRPSA